MIRRLNLEGTCNARDIGGFSTADGCQTRWHTIVRSARLSSLSAAGQQAVLDYGIQTIIDLRDEPEIQAAPNVFEDSRLLTYMNMPLLGDLQTTDLWKSTLAAMQTQYDAYHVILAHCQPQIKAILSTITQLPPGTLIHCSGGKDRTGIMIALLLTVASVPEPTIVEDYALSYSELIEWREANRTQAAQTGYDMRRFEVEWGCAPEDMIRTFAHLNTMYGDPLNYLKTCGLTNDELHRLRTLLVENADQ